MIFDDDSLIRCAELAAPQRLQAAQLASEAFGALYDGLGSGFFSVLADEFLIEGAELSEAVALVRSQVDGLVACYPANEYQVRQRISLHHALSTMRKEVVNKFLSQMRQLSSEIPPLDADGEYLARFAIKPELRGSGTADTLMKLLSDQYSSICLHVAAENLRAISFYLRHGFVVKDGTKKFLLMQRI